MGTLTITAAGFAALPAQAPPKWPAGVVWPGGGSPNGAKAYTISDADWIAILQWSEYAAIGNGVVAVNAGTSGAPTPQTAGQVLINFVQQWANGIRAAVQQYFTAAPVVPAPPTMT